MNFEVTGSKNLERSQVSGVQMHRLWVWIQLRDHQTCLPASVLLFRLVLCFGFFLDGIVCRNSVNTFDLVCMSFCAVETLRHDIFWRRRVLGVPGLEQETDRILSGFSKQDTLPNTIPPAVLTGCYFLNRILPGLSWQEGLPSQNVSCTLQKRHFLVSLKGGFLHSPDRIPFLSFLKGNFLVSWQDTSRTVCQRPLRLNLPGNNITDWLPACSLLNWNKKRNWLWRKWFLSGN